MFCNGSEKIHLENLKTIFFCGAKKYLMKKKSTIAKVELHVAEKKSVWLPSENKSTSIISQRVAWKRGLESKSKSLFFCSLKRPKMSFFFVFSARYSQKKRCLTWNPTNLLQVRSGNIRCLCWSTHHGLTTNYRCANFAFMKWKDRALQ